MSADDPDEVFQAIERLHRDQLVAGALAHMPSGFLADFYRFLAGRPDCRVVIARSGPDISGFVAGTLRATGLLRAFLKDDVWRAVSYALRTSWRLRLAYRLALIARGTKGVGTGLTAGERQLLSIVVDPACQRHGIGVALFDHLKTWFQSAGAGDFDIIAAHTQTAAVQFYCRVGAENIGETRIGDLDSTIFRCAIDGDQLATRFSKR